MRMKNFLIMRLSGIVFVAFFVCLSLAGHEEGIELLNKPLSESFSAGVSDEFIQIIDLWESVEKIASYLDSDVWVYNLLSNVSLLRENESVCDFVLEQKGILEGDKELFKDKEFFNTVKGNSSIRAVISGLFPDLTSLSYQNDLTYDTWVAALDHVDAPVLVKEIQNQPYRYYRSCEKIPLSAFQKILKNPELLEEIKQRVRLDNKLRFDLLKGLPIEGEKEYQTYFDQTKVNGFDRQETLKEWELKLKKESILEPTYEWFFVDAAGKGLPFNFENKLEELRVATVEKDSNKMVEKIISLFRANMFYLFVLKPESKNLRNTILKLQKKFLTNSLTEQSDPSIDQVRQMLQSFSLFIKDSLFLIESIQPMLQSYNQNFLNTVKESPKENNTKALHVLCTKIAAFLSAMISDYNSLLKIAKKHAKMRTFRDFDMYKYPITFGPKPVFLFKRFGVRFEFKGIPK